MSKEGRVQYQLLLQAIAYAKATGQSTLLAPGIRVWHPALSAVAPSYWFHAVLTFFYKVHPAGPLESDSWNSYLMSPVAPSHWYMQ